MFFVWWWVPSSKNSRTYSHVYSLSLCGQFSSGQGPVRTRKAVANSQTSWLQRHFIFIQEVSGAYTSAFLDTEKLKMALRARNVSGAFEKRAPDPVLSRAIWTFLLYYTPPLWHQRQIVSNLDNQITMYALRFQCISAIMLCNKDVTICCGSQ